VIVSESFLDLVQKQGFAVAPYRLSAGEIDALIAGLSEWSLRRSRAGIRHLMNFPEINKLARSSPLLEIACSVLGTGATPFRATLFDKSSDSNWLVAWHQDTALPLQERKNDPGWGPWSVKEGILYACAPAQALSQVLALRLHLDASSAENGPLRVLSGTHTNRVLTKAEIHELVQRSQEVACLVPRGGLLAMRPLLVHASSKSRSPEPRRVLHIEYAAASLLEELQLAVA